MNNDTRISLAWGGGIILIALAATLARQQGYIDQDMMLRIVLGINGLMVAYYGNLAPKSVAPSACSRQVARVSGWSFVLSGLFYTGLWIFAPVSVAMTLGTGAIALGLIVTLGYCFWLRSQASAA